MTYIIELCGVAVFAVTGCLAGGRKRMDLFGVIVVGIVTALGGGTLRDLVLDAPVFWVVDNAYIFAAGASGFATFIAVRYRPAPTRLLLFLDAIGMALFTLLGAQKALGLGTSLFIAVMMGAMTGAAGGLLRDLLCNELPQLFVSRDLYATPALVGAAVFVGMRYAEVPSPWPFVVGFSLILGIRLASLKWDLALPYYRDRTGSP